MNADESVLQKCLFFTANRLSNVLRRMANETYKSVGVSTPNVYLLIIVNQYPDITITELSEKLDITPSTCTRFVNSLEKQNILKKRAEWKTVHISLTEKGREITENIDNALMTLAKECIDKYGCKESTSLAESMWEAANILSKK